MSRLGGGRGRGIGGEPPEELDVLFRSSGAGRVGEALDSGGHGGHEGESYRGWGAGGDCLPAQTEADAHASLLLNPLPVHVVHASARRWAWAKGLDREACFAALATAWADFQRARELPAD